MTENILLNREVVLQELVELRRDVQARRDVLLEHGRGDEAENVEDCIGDVSRAIARIFPDIEEMPDLPSTEERERRREEIGAAVRNRYGRKE